VVAVVAAIAIAGVVMWGIAVGFSVESSEDERAMLPTVADLGLDDGQERSGGTYTKTRYIDGTWMIEYEYEDANIYMHAAIGHEHSQRDARTVFAAEAAVTNVGIGLLTGAERVEDPSLYRGGDERECNRLVVGGQTTGYTISVRDDTDVISLLIGGAVFEDAPTVLTEILDPMLAAL
jgi:hypothetical protein